MIREMLLLGVVALFQTAPAPAERVIGFPDETLNDHRIGGETSVEVPVKRTIGYRAFDVRVTIGTDGNVTDARVSADRRNGGDDDAAPALAAARALKFRPFTYRGAPVVAEGTVEIDYLNPGEGGWRDREAALPPIDYANLRITLTRSACYGSCPDYRVTIDGAGNVEFTTSADSVPGAAEVHRLYSEWNGVLAGGTHRTKIDRATLDALIERFRRAHFFGLRKEYVAQITDSPTYVIGFQSGSQGWEVTDYVGARAGMPDAVRVLEDAIDAAAGSARWIEGDAGTLPALIAGGLDPRGKDARALAVQSAQSANGIVAADLVAAGLPLDASVTVRNRELPLGRALLELAADRAEPGLFAAVAAKGWLARMPRAALNTLFAETGGGCDAGTARLMVGAGADPAAHTPAADPHDMGYSEGRTTALISAVHGYRCDRAPNRPALVAALLALGVDVNAVDGSGKSVIFGVEDPELLDQLLAAGARTDIKGRDGNSAVFSSWTDVIALRLLEAGADPVGYYEQGGRKMTLREIAHERDMPATLAWLDAHGVK